MFLSDQTILDRLANGSILIDPFARDRLQPASYDLTLGTDFLFPFDYVTQVIDPTDLPAVDCYMGALTAGPDGIKLSPGSFLLGTTAETIHVPNGIRASIEGKSSLARLGLAPHIAAGYIDPGFRGRVTLEFVNHAPWAIRLRPGMRIAQIAFAFVDSLSIRPYGDTALGSHYQGQTTVQESRS